MNAGEQGTELVCTFWLGDLYFGIDVRDVQEVLRDAEITPIPHAPPSVAGLINLRGQIATTIDLRDRLGVDRVDDPARRPSHVVVTSSGEQVSLLVDRVGEVLEVGPELFEPPPVTMRADLAEMIIGICKLPADLLLVVDVDAVVDIPVERGGSAA